MQETNKASLFERSCLLNTSNKWSGSTLPISKSEASDLDIGRVDPDHLFEVLSKQDLSKSDALFVSCTALPVLSIISNLEKKLGKIVLSSNQTLIWDTLNQIDYKNKIAGYGELFNS